MMRLPLPHADISFLSPHLRFPFSPAKMETTTTTTTMEMTLWLMTCSLGFRVRLPRHTCTLTHVLLPSHPIPLFSCDHFLFLNLALGVRFHSLLAPRCASVCVCFLLVTESWCGCTTRLFLSFDCSFGPTSAFFVSLIFVSLLGMTPRGYVLADDYAAPPSEMQLLPRNSAKIKKKR